MLAHLADFEPVFRERLERIVRENEPLLPDVDEEALAQINHYAQADPVECVARYTREREKTVAFLQTVPPQSWTRTGIREPHGAMSLDAVATLILAHDTYHLAQVAEYAAWKKPTG
jgi:uncharacterized damage-inducible protein DinB